MLPTLQFVSVVWQTRYICNFVEGCLPSLFASQNIPCIYQKVPIKFKIYTSKEDERTIIDSEI